MMSAPGIGKKPQLALLDFSLVAQLPKPHRALVYLVLLTVLTVIALAALATAVVVIGEVTGTFKITDVLTR
jgi:hypothetical protein